MSIRDQTQFLIQQARDGNRGAFDEIVRRYTNAIALLIRLELGARLRRKVEVDDLVQDTFSRAFRSIKDFRGKHPGTFSRWLGAIAQHVVQDQARRFVGREAKTGHEVSLSQAVGTKDSESSGLGASLKAAMDTPSENLRQIERFNRLGRALAALTPDHRKVILLARIRELPLKEVARQMQRSVEATSMLLYRALLKLKDAFGTTDSLDLPADMSLDDGRWLDG